MGAAQHEFIEKMAAEIRRLALSAIYSAGSGHPGGSLSCADLVATLYFHVMRVDPLAPAMPDRDRFVLSKGHAAPSLYSALALRGFFPKEELGKLRKFGAMLQGHPEPRHTPGIDAVGGSLGQGYAVAAGMAMAAKLDKAEYRIYALLGDGELQEGIIWEAAMSSAHFRLRHLIAFVDHNGLQIDGAVKDVMNIGDIADKFRAFGHYVQSVDGHSIPVILEAVQNAKNHQEGPSMIILNTTKGKGVSFMENQAGWHGRAPTRDEYEKAIVELEGMA